MMFFSDEVKALEILPFRPRFFAGNAYESSETSGDLFCRYWVEVSNGICKKSQLGDRAEIEPDQNRRNREKNLRIVPPRENLSKS